MEITRASETRPGAKLHTLLERADWRTKTRCAAREEANKAHPLLKLPAEIRNEIYAYCVPKDQFIRAHALNDRNSWPTLSQVCRHTRAEVLPMFLANNVASFDLSDISWDSEPGRSREFLDMFRDSTIGLLERFQFYVHLNYVHSCTWTKPRQFFLGVQIDRRTETIEIVRATADRGQAGGPSNRRNTRGNQCCRDAEDKYLRRLVAQIESLGLQKKTHQLRKKDFKKLTSRMYWKTWVVRKPMNAEWLESNFRNHSI